MDGPGGTNDGVSVVDWRDLMQESGDSLNEVASQVARLKRTDTACLIYTSGTGGRPKGVMLSHGAILCNSMGAYHLFADSAILAVNREVFLSFLPLSHFSEHTAGLNIPSTHGPRTYTLGNAH